MLICTEAWSLAVMRRFVAALKVRTQEHWNDKSAGREIPFTWDVEVDNFSLVVFHVDALDRDWVI